MQTGPELKPKPALKSIEISTQVTAKNITAVLGVTKLLKALRPNNLPNGFLKACGKPLQKALAVLATKCFELGWFPAEYKHAKTVVIFKLNKTSAVYKTVQSYKLIALFACTSKVIKAVLAKKITKAAEMNNLLPAEQMGNRKKGSQNWLSNFLLHR